MTAAEIHALLPSMADEKYRVFNTALLPGVSGVLGVRMPDLRKLGKSIAREDWRGYLDAADASSYEAVQLQGIVIGYAKESPEVMLPYIARHVEKLDNWSTCDTFCTSLKIARAHPEDLWAFVIPYFSRRDAYALRFAIVMAIFHYLDQAHLEDVLAYLDAIRHEEYYVRMAVAWAVSMAYVANPKRVLAYLRHNNLDDWTYNKSLQKIIESRQVDEVTRDVMRRMKRKGTANA